MHAVSKVKGFTLIELMIAVAIILVMLSILAVSFFEARQNSRDRQRVSDLTQIQFALTGYNEVNETYPQLDSPLEINQGYITIAEGSLGDYWDEEVVDPSGDTSGAYEYRIVPELECGDDTFYAVVAIQMELSKNSNGAEVCPGNSAMDNAYVVLIAGPLVDGGSANYQIEEGDGTEWWNETENQTWIGDINE